MRTFKRSISILLSVLMLISLLSVAVPTASAAEENTVYFVNTSQWSKVNVYCWYDDGSGENKAWPGESATLTASAGVVGVYSYDVGSYDGVVFNNGGATKTSDLSADSLRGKYYEPKTKNAYDTLEAAMAAYYGVTSNVVYYVCGSYGLCGSEWLETDPECAMTANSDGSYSKTFTGVASGTYEFKINSGKWASQGGEEYPTYNYVISVEENNSTVKITLSAAKNIIVDVTSPQQQTTQNTAQTTTSSSTAYYNYSLVGYINGKNVGEGADAGSFPYIFNLNGQITIDITETSYVYAKTTDNVNWYMTAGWLGSEVRSATMYNTENMPDDRPCDKLQVNPGKATFTLVINNDDTLTLSYTLDSDGTTASTNTTATSTTKPSSNYYFPTCSSSYTSLYSALESVGYVGKDWNYYCTIAVVNGLTDYTGTAEQNEVLLNLLKAGKLINPDGSGQTEATETTSSGGTIRPTTKYFPACDSSFTTLAAGFASVGIDYSSLSYRTIIAQVNGISDYKGTTDQNGYLLALLKQGLLVNPDYNSDADNTEPSETVSNMVYIVNNVGWDQVYVYYWGGTQKKEKVYPGELATLIDKENNVYSFDIGDSKGVIFTDGGSEKTIKMGASQAINKFYSIAASMFYDSIEKAISGRDTSGLIPVEPPEYYFTVMGDKQLCGSDWNASDESNILEYNNNNSRYEITYKNVPKGEYSFLVITNGVLGYYDFNLEGKALDIYDYASVKVSENNSTVVIGCDAVKAYASVNGEEVDPGDSNEENSYLTYTFLNDGTAQINGFIGTVEHLVIPDEINGHTVTSISSNAFYYCQSFKSVTIPSTIKDIGLYAFEGCTRLSAVYISDMSAWCNIEFGNIYSNPLFYAHYLYLNGELVTELKVPEDVSEIKVGAFYSCFSLRNVVLPQNIRFISLMAFWNCINLESITIYNDNCGFYEDSTTIPASTMLYGHNGSSSHMFASNFGRTFINLNVVSCHIWSKEDVTNSNCAQDGKSTKMCIICGEVKTEVIEASGHLFNTGTVKKKATYFAKGKKVAVCMVCGQEKTVKIAKLKLSKPTVSITAGKKQITVKYNKVKGATGFQVRYKYGIYSYKKNFAAKKNVKKVLTKLEPGNYKVQVRAMVSKGGKKAYSKWTTAKKVKVKA